MKAQFNFRYLILFIPWALSSLYDGTPVLSYFIAWLGSILIFYLSISGKIASTPRDLPLKNQFMRPLFLVQLIFAGYMAMSTIFFFVDTLGYHYFTLQPFTFVNIRELDLVAQCQRYYVLGHGSYTAGLLLFTQPYVEKEWKLNWNRSLSAFFIRATIVTIIASLIFNFVPGLDQFAVKFRELSYISSILAFVFAIIEKNTSELVVASFIFGMNFLAAILSGWKEPIIVTIIVLGGYLYPIYKRTVLIMFIPIFMAVVFILPSYNALYREQAWTGGVEDEQAAQLAIEAIQTGEVDLASANWLFLTDRLSEISMFVDYVDKVPNQIDYYGLQIYKDAILFLIPRVFWPGKPDVEQHVMERVYRIGITSSSNDVSAKPPLIVDAYLTGGIFYIAILLLVFGAITSWLCHKCEELFGGYTIGTAWVYAGVFQILWRGTCMEFLFNSVFWGIITMYLIFYTMRRLNLLVPIKN